MTLRVLLLLVAFIATFGLGAAERRSRTVTESAASADHDAASESDSASATHPPNLGFSWTPFSTAPPTFQSTQHPLPPTSHWGKAVSNRPKPTCRWWQNLVLRPAHQPVTVNPLAMRVETMDTNKLSLESYYRANDYSDCVTNRTGTHCPSWSTDEPSPVSDLTASQLRAKYGRSTRRAAHFCLAPVTANTELVGAFFQPGFAMSAEEELEKHEIIAYDPLSVTMQFPGANGGSLIFPLVRGMPYATGLYRGLTPHLFTIHAILAANGQGLPGKVKGKKVKLRLNNEQTILIYAWKDGQSRPYHDDDEEESRHDYPYFDLESEWESWMESESGAHDEVEWEWDRNNIRLLGGKGNWVVRMAFLAGRQEDPKELEQAYDQYADTIPVGGDWNFEFQQATKKQDGNDDNDDDDDDDDDHDDDNGEKNGDNVVSTLTFKTRNRFDHLRQALNCSSEHLSDRHVLCKRVPDAPELMTLALLHHQRTLQSPQWVPKAKLNTLLGDVMATTGSTWTLVTPAPDRSINWRAPRDIDPNRRQQLARQIFMDIQEHSQATEPDPYGFGKSIAKIGRMVLMAEELGVDTKLLRQLLDIMKQYLKPWLEGSNADALLYDTTYGGIVSTNGLKDPAQDFGQGYYNDHHFHYGYILFGCAVVSRFDAGWAIEYRDEILSLVRDYANPAKDGSDPHFPFLRQFDPFDSHSWAAGLFVFGDGRNQESSSESINSYYALHLLGLAWSDPRMAELGRALWALEVEGTRSYWHMTTKQSAYPEVFAKNKCIGMKWSNKVVDATWFAAGKVFVHGINMLPFTPASETYLVADWVQEEYPVVRASFTPAIPDEWRGFIYGTHCVIDSQQAWKEIERLVTFDGGNTRSNLMYFCATRPKQKHHDHDDDDDGSENDNDERHHVDDERELDPNGPYRPSPPSPVQPEDAHSSPSSSHPSIILKEI